MSVTLRLAVILALSGCVAATSTGRHVTCEHKTMKLDCGKLYIKVISANYGRTNKHTCSSGRPPHQVKNTKCFNQPRSLAAMAKSCDGETTCSVRASNSVFSDPCGRTFKYLDVLYTCTALKPAGPTPVLQCERDVMLVGLLLAELEAAGLDASSAHLVDRRCSIKRHGNGTVWYQVERTEGTCGNTLRTNGSHAIYSNTLFVYPNETLGANGTLVQPLSIPFSCHYSLDAEASLDVAIRPFLGRRDRLSGGLIGSGPRARASMSLFRSARYSSAYPAGRVTLPLGSVLYVGVAVEEVEKKRFVVVLENCYATHTADPEDPKRHFLIQRKCPSDRRQVAVSESGSSLQARFSALLFLFQGDYRDVFLHCSLSLCDQHSATCRPDCSGRSRRSVSESVLLKPVTIGPITWDQTLE